MHEPKHYLQDILCLSMHAKHRAHHCGYPSADRLSLDGQCTAHDITEICYQWADTQMMVAIYLGQHATDYIHHMY